MKQNQKNSEPKELISIIVPCYNSAEFIDETVRSIINQTYINWECIIINDGSKDNSEELIRNWCNRDDRIKYLTQKNAGLSSARNRGLELANGSFIQFLDSDDIIHPSKLELQLADILEKEVDISVCDYMPMENQFGTFISSVYQTPFLKKNNYMHQLIVNWETGLSIPCHTVLFKRAIIEKHKLRFNELLPNHEDWSFWVKLFYHSKGFENIKFAFAIYRIRTGSLSRDGEMMHHGFKMATLDIIHYFNNIPDPNMVRLAKTKLSLINKPKKKSFKKILSYFIPPIIIIAVKLIKDKLINIIRLFDKQNK
jgi:glycosyltransferase involved in cell wall biosynthesis